MKYKYRIIKKTNVPMFGDPGRIWPVLYIVERNTYYFFSINTEWYEIDRFCELDEAKNYIKKQLTPRDEGKLIAEIKCLEDLEKVKE